MIYCSTSTIVQIDSHAQQRKLGHILLPASVITTRLLIFFILIGDIIQLIILAEILAFKSNSSDYESDELIYRVIDAKSRSVL